MANKTSKHPPSRAAHVLRPSDIEQVLCHRRVKGWEQYLVRWRTKAALAPSAVCSWHTLGELSRVLHLVQTYVETHRTCPKKDSSLAGTLEALPSNRKRKSPNGDVAPSHDSVLGMAADEVRNSTPRSLESSPGVAREAVRVYNGTLEKKDGWVVAKASRKAVAIDATTLPNAQMMEEASRTPTTQAERANREGFYRKVRRVPHLSLENAIDSSTPSLDFTFTNDYVLGDGVYRADPDSFEGCQAPCRPNMGQFIGCEYPRLCSCLEYAAVNEAALEKDEPARYQEYLRQKFTGEYIDKTNLPKRFPYHKPKGENMPQTLQTLYRDSRHPIYECNLNCKCGSVCKSRVVQKGRKVPLTIFKTPSRGWGAYCREDLIQGEFIDTYRGEIITNEEADRRESQAGKDKASYLYSLDKFVDDTPELTAENCYVVDGQYMGGPTRFINHSCEPNCRQYTVSYNKHDPRVYDLAFFAIEDIPAGTELTFDYMDKDEEEEDDVLRRRQEAAADPDNMENVPCNCGARKCRGFLWI